MQREMYDLKLNGDLELAAEMFEYFTDRYDALAITCDPQKVSMCREIEESFRVSAERLRASIEFNQDYKAIAGEPGAGEAMANAVSILEQLKNHAESRAGEGGSEMDFTSDASNFNRAFKLLSKSLALHKERHPNVSC